MCTYWKRIAVDIKELYLGTLRYMNRSIISKVKVKSKDIPITGRGGP
jgi:hypothetical protein